MNRIHGRRGSFLEAPTGNRNRAAMVLLLSLIVLLMASVIGGCGSEEPDGAAGETGPDPEPTAIPTFATTPVPTPTALAAVTTPTAVSAPTVEEVFGRATAAMDALQSASVRTESTSTSRETSGLRIVRQGHFRAPDQSQLTLNLGSKDSATATAYETVAEYEAIVIGAESFYTDPDTGAWLRADYFFELAGSGDYLGQVDLHFSTEELAGISLVAVESLDGEPVYHLAGELPYDSVPSLIVVPTIDDKDLLDMVEVEARAEFWIGTDDYLVRKLVVTSRAAAAALDDVIQSETVVTYSEFGIDVDIQPPEINDADDHGDSPDVATEIGVGGTVSGTIGDFFDYDYFVFQAEEGQGYTIDVTPGTLGRPGLVLLDAYGEDLEWIYGGDDSTPLVQITWVAPESGEFYVYVETLGEAGTYSLTVTAVGAAPPDTSSNDLQTETLADGRIKAVLPSEGIQIIAPRSWVLNTEVTEPFNFTSQPLLVGKEPAGTGGRAIRAQFGIQSNFLYPVYESLEMYVDVTIANIAFFADIEEEDIEIQAIDLPAGEARLVIYSNASPTQDVTLTHHLYIFPAVETAIHLTFTAAATDIEELAPIFAGIAETLEIDA